MWNLLRKSEIPSGNYISFYHILFYVIILATILHGVVAEEVILRGSNSDTPNSKGADVEIEEPSGLNLFFIHAVGLAQSGAIALGSAFVGAVSDSQHPVENKCMKVPFDFVNDKDNLHYRGTAEVYNNGDFCVFPMTLNVYNYGIEGAMGHLKDFGKKTAQFTIDHDKKWKAVVEIEVDGK